MSVLLVACPDRCQTSRAGLVARSDRCQTSRAGLVTRKDRCQISRAGLVARKDRSQVSRPNLVARPDSTKISAGRSVARPDSAYTGGTILARCPDSSQVSRLGSVACPDSSWRILEPAEIAYQHANSLVVTPRAAATLVGPYGVMEYLQLTYGETTDAGWDWSATLRAEHITDFDAAAPWRIYGQDGLGGSFSSPPLVAGPRESTDTRSETGEGAHMSGMDATTRKIARSNQSFPTFKATTSTALLGNLASHAGIVIRQAPLFPVLSEEVKNHKLADAIERCLAVAGCEHTISTQGELVCWKFSDTGGAIDFDWSSRKRSTDPNRRFTSIKIGKRSPIVGGQTQTEKGEFLIPFTDTGPKSFPLDNPLSNAFAVDRSTLGYVDWVGFWQGDPANRGKLIEFYSFHDDFINILPTDKTGVWPATHVNCTVFGASGIIAMFPGAPVDTVQAYLKVIGSPPSVLPKGVDLAFATVILGPGVTLPNAGLWPAEDWYETLFWTKKAAIANGPNILAIKNKGWDKLTLDGVYQCGVFLRQTAIYLGNTYKVDRTINQIPAEGIPSTTVELVRTTA